MRIFWLIFVLIETTAAIHKGNQPCFTPYDPVALDFSNKVLIIHPVAFNLGRCILVIGVLALIAGAVTSYTGQFFVPPSIWFAGAVPTIGVGGAFVACSMTRP